MARCLFSHLEPITIYGDRGPQPVLPIVKACLGIDSPPGADTESVIDGLPGQAPFLEAAW